MAIKTSKQKNTTKKITIDDLAVMVAKGFNGVEERLDRVENRLGRVEDRLEKVEENQFDMKLRIDNVAYKFEIEDLKKRVSVVERKAGIKTA